MIDIKEPREPNQVPSTCASPSTAKPIISIRV